MSAISKHYAWLGRARSILGRAVGSEVAAGHEDGRVQVYQNGRIYWHPEVGAHEVHGAILARYLSPNMLVALGYPTSDELRCHDQVGRISRFQRGVIIWHPRVGAHDVRGLILDKWCRLGAERSVLGYPTAGEAGLPNYWRGEFEGGEIYASVATGAYEIHGDIWRRWQTEGGVTGPGLPLIDETPTSDGVGRISRFQNRWIRWTPNGGTQVGT